LFLENLANNDSYGERQKNTPISLKSLIYGFFILFEFYLVDKEKFCRKDQQ